MTTHRGNGVGIVSGGGIAAAAGASAFWSTAPPPPPPSSMDQALRSAVQGMNTTLDKLELLD
jgi:hypothetical protein